MQYKCEKCNDRGMLLGSYNFDCSACEAATDRVALEAFIESLPAMGEQNQAWAIHQRALAMAPKQEAPTSAFDAATFIEKKAASYLDENSSTDPDDGSTVFHYGSAGSAYYNGLVELAEEIRIAAPAAANGALTDEQIQQAANDAVKRGELSWLGFDKDDQDSYTIPVLSKSHFQFARAIAAALSGAKGD